MHWGFFDCQQKGFLARFSILAQITYINFTGNNFPGNLHLFSMYLYKKLNEKR